MGSFVLWKLSHARQVARAVGGSRELFEISSRPINFEIRACFDT